MHKYFLQSLKSIIELVLHNFENKLYDLHIQENGSFWSVLIHLTVNSSIYWIKSK